MIPKILPNILWKTVYDYRLWNPLGSGFEFGLNEQVHVFIQWQYCGQTNEYIRKCPCPEKKKKAGGMVQMAEYLPSMNKVLDLDSIPSTAKKGKQHSFQDWVRWLITTIPATRKVAIRRITVWQQPRQMAKIPSQLTAGCSGTCLSSLLQGKHK
jgi:hypothetical protein